MFVGLLVNAALAVVIEPSSWGMFLVDWAVLMPPRSRTAAVSALASYGGEESPVTGAMPAETQRRQRVMSTPGCNSRTHSRAGSIVMLN